MLSSTNPGTAKKFQTASEIDRVASGNLDKEQTWVEQLLKRVKTEADVQSQVTVCLRLLGD